MTENSIRAVSNIDQKQLDDILSTIKGYEVEVVVCGNNSYNCTWVSNNFNFRIRVVKDLDKTLNENNNFDSPVIYILLHCGDDKRVLDQINNFNHDNGILVIFDENEDIQVFSKDIWNLLISLKSSN